MTTPTLKPLSEAEVEDLLTRLGASIHHHGADAVSVGMTRLALTAANALRARPEIRRIEVPVRVEVPVDRVIERVVTKEAKPDIARILELEGKLLAAEQECEHLRQRATEVDARRGEEAEELRKIRRGADDTSDRLRVALLREAKTIERALALEWAGRNPNVAVIAAGRSGAAPCCPSCGGIDPAITSRHKGRIGHVPNCVLAEFLLFVRTTKSA